MRDFDFLVLGGGSAGYAAASAAVSLGLRVGLIEGAGELGGLCILRGCMPSKALIESANHYADLRRAGEFGLSAGPAGFSIAKIHERKARHVAGFADYRAGQLEGGRFQLLRGWASLVDPHTVEVRSEAGTARHTAETILIATGSRIKKVAIPGLEETGYWTSDTVLSTPEMPKSVIVLGGGATAVEFAHYFSALGARTTIIQRSNQLVKEMDADLARVLTQAFRQRGVSVHCNTALVRVEPGENGLKRIVYTQGGETRSVEAEQIVYALGREPNTAGLALQNAGLECTGGCPSTGLTQQTNVPHIFAAGDVCGPYEVVHIAIAQAEVAARNAARLLKGEGRRVLEEMDYRLRLFVIFTEPELARVGMSEAELQSEGIPYRVATYPFDDHGKSILMEEKLGFVKLITGEESGEIVGAAVAGPRASELIHEIVVAMRFRATAAQLAAIPHYHPTLSEIWTYPAEELANGMV